MKTHLAVSTNSAFDNGTLTTTLCGRMNKSSHDGMNSTGNHAEVTCEHCKTILAWPQHWRYRKFLN